jgi:hypothetical protein
MDLSREKGMSEWLSHVAPVAQYQQRFRQIGKKAYTNPAQPKMAKNHAFLSGICRCFILRPMTALSNRSGQPAVAVHDTEGISG